jgi:hypothetical protein
MRILIDECAPKALKQHLTGHRHECLTVQEAGWSGKQNGELLNLAEAAFDAFVTYRYESSLPAEFNGSSNFNLCFAVAVQSS